MPNLTGLLGIGLFVLVAWAMSSARDRFPWRIVMGGLALQFVLAFLLLRFGPVVTIFEGIAWAVQRIISMADAGIEFVFGPVIADVPSSPLGFVFAIHALCVIIYFAALTAVLYHVGVMGRLVAALAWLLRGTLGVTGAEALAMASNVFVGQTEAPLCVRPFIDRMTRSQLMTLMVGGFATIAGSVLAVYVAILGGEDEARQALFVKHLIVASVLSAPAAFVMAKVIVPETETPIDEGLKSAAPEERPGNVLDAAARGATDGLRLALNVGAMLVAFVSLLALINWPLEAIGDIDQIRAWREARGIGPLDLQTLLGWLLAPVAWLMGVPWVDATAFGSLLGQKVIVTEFVAYPALAEMSQQGRITDRTTQIAAYALCGFGNLPSIAIQIGGLTALAPTRRAEFAALGFRAMIGGAMASWMTACVAGLFIQ